MDSENGYDNQAFQSAYNIGGSSGYSPYTNPGSLYPNTRWYGQYGNPLYSRFRRSRPHDKEDNQGRSNKVCLAVVIGVIVLFIAGLMSVGIYYAVKEPTEPEAVDTVTVADINGELILDMDFKEDLNDPTSALYQAQEEQFCGSIDSLMAQTAISPNYLGCTVNDFSNGSVKVDYTTQFTAASETEASSTLLEVVEDAVDTAVQSNTLIPNVTVTKEKPMVVEVTEVEATELATCAGDYNGGCSQICEEVNDDIICSCNDGYEKAASNPNSCTDINECDAGPCENDGTCVNSAGSYTCRCTDGYTDKHCDTDIDECDENPCDNGGTCSNNDGSYTCECIDGFTGQNCDSDIDECDENPCDNGGTCSNNDGSYTCECTDGFTGQNCDSDIDECDENPCDNGGTCSNNDGSYTCECIDGFTGQNCDSDIDECDENPCDNGGTCSNNDGSYTCECTDGFTGQNCDSDIDECDENPCDNGGTCSNNDGSYTCECIDGFTGQNCDSDIDECDENPCDNGGTCSNNDGSYTCECTDGFTGQNCDSDIDECDENPCDNGGTCSNNDGSYTCECIDGFTGQNCDSDIDECDENPCDNGGTCSNNDGSYTCECTDGFTGQNCDSDIDECDGNPCDNGGTCSNNDGSFTCECTHGFTGQNCDSDIDECDENPCDNGGTCSNNDGSYTCECIDGFTGQNCDSEITVIEGTMLLNRPVLALAALPKDSADFISISQTFCTGMDGIIEKTSFNEFYDGCSVSEISDEGAGNYQVTYSLSFGKILDRTTIVSSVSVSIASGDADFGGMTVEDITVEGINWCETSMDTCGLRVCDHENTLSSNVKCKCEEEERWSETDNSCEEITLLKARMLVNSSVIDSSQPGDDVFQNISLATCHGYEGIIEQTDFSGVYEECEAVDTRYVGEGFYEVGFTLLFGGALDNTKVASAISEVINDEKADFGAWNIVEAFVEGVDWCETVLNFCDYRGCNDIITNSSDIQCFCDEDHKWDVEQEQCTDYTLIIGQIIVQLNLTDVQPLAVQDVSSDEYDHMSQSFCNGMEDAFKQTEFWGSYDKCTVYHIEDKGQDYVIVYTIGFNGIVDKQEVVAAVTESMAAEDVDQTTTLGDLIVLESFVEGVDWCDTVVSAYCGARGCDSEATYSSAVHCHCYDDAIWMNDLHLCKSFHGLELVPFHQSVDIVAQVGLDHFGFSCQTNPPDPELHAYLHWTDPDGNRLPEFTNETYDEVGSPRIFTFEIPTLGHKSIAILNTTEEDSGMYTCHMDMPDGISFDINITLTFQDCNVSEWNFCHDEMTCYSNEQECDGVADCNYFLHDARDENFCSFLPNCSRYEFACPEFEHICLPGEWLCDGSLQCPGGEDELNCEWCGWPQRRCWSGECLYQEHFCDGIVDCEDSSDEAFCFTRCTEGFSNCPMYDGICLSNDSFCDGIDDCPRGVDEPLDCPCTVTCSSGECISRFDTCDGFCDCESCEDEAECECEKDTFVCDSGFCTNRKSKYVHCNGKPDCSDGSDEEANCECRDDQIFCPEEQQCLPEWQVCAGHVECVGVDVDQLECAVTSIEASVVVTDNRLALKTLVDPGSAKHNYISDLWCDVVDRAFLQSEYRDQYDECYMRSIRSTSEMGHYEVQYTVILDQVLDRTEVITAVFDSLGYDFDVNHLSIYNLTAEGVNWCKSVQNYCGRSGCNETANTVQCLCDGVWFSEIEKCVDVYDLVLVPTLVAINLTVQTGLPRFALGCQTIPPQNGLLPYIYWVETNGESIPVYDEESEGNEKVISTTEGNLKMLIFKEATEAQSGNYTCKLDATEQHTLHANLTLDFKDCDSDGSLQLCSDGMTCFAKDQACDGKLQCGYNHFFDRLDEKNCPHSPCGNRSVSCPQYDYWCIPESAVCDGHPDCDSPIALDEIGCDMCIPPRLPCGEKDCISSFQICDGEVNCDDASDEANCDTVCDEGSSNCPEYDGVCVRNDFLCDGFYDCPKGLDELDNCSCSGVECSSGECVVKEHLCDGMCHCGDSCEDENDCDCEPDTYVCDNSYCTGQKPRYVHCNAQQQCEDGSDEAENCECRDDQFLCLNEGEPDKCVPDWQVCAELHECDTKEKQPKCDMTTLHGVAAVVKTRMFYSVSLKENSLLYESIATTWCDWMQHLASQTEFADDFEQCHVKNIRVIEKVLFQISYVLAIDRDIRPEDIVSGMYDAFGLTGETELEDLTVVASFAEDVKWCETSVNQCGPRGCYDYSHDSVAIGCYCGEDQIWVASSWECRDQMKLVLVPSVQPVNITVQSHLDKFFLGCQTAPRDDSWLESLQWINVQTGEVVPEGADDVNDKVTSKLEDGYKALIFSNAAEQQSGAYQCVLRNDKELELPEGLEPDISATLDFKDCANDANFQLCEDGVTCYSENQICDKVVDCSYNYYYDGKDERNCSLSNCEESKVTCLGSDEECISKKWICDDYDDCPGGTDELHCHFPCIAPAFQCSDSSKCIFPLQVCDGASDCEDASDEIDCNTVCDVDKVNCPKFDGICIPDYYLCDDYLDCPFGLDEENCPCEGVKCADGTCAKEYQLCNGYCDCNTTCEDEYNITCPCDDGAFLCDDGFCTQSSTVSTYCDGRIDCPDGSDEPAECECKEGQVSCGEPGNQTCLSHVDVCYGYTYCPANEDLNCTCEDYYFKCGQVCRFMYFWCNGVEDCPDGTDEVNCNASRCHPELQFECNDKSCYPRSYACNGYPDCEEAEDEIQCENECGENRTSCPGYPGICLYDYQFCNEYEDCPQATDERDCPCSGFNCTNGDCVRSWNVCDGYCHCGNVTCEDELEANCSCPEHNFECDNGLCLHKEQKYIFCDGNIDCPDGSDEPEDCECLDGQLSCGTGANQSCVAMDRFCNEQELCPGQEHLYDDCPKCDPKYYFECDDGQCLASYGECDNYADCPGGEDEINCDIDCSTNYTTCPGYPGICIHESWICDDYADCPKEGDEEDCPCTGIVCANGDCARGRQVCDGVCDCGSETCEDEKDANCTCHESYFHCDDGLCIHEEEKYVFCNGIIDCPDSSDEPEDCECLDEQLSCGTGVDHSCVAIDRFCNGSEECPGQENYDCPCPHDQFKCDGYCRYLSAWCDGYVDCDDGSDEDSCENSVCHPRLQYECKGGQCIHESYICDGEVDCHDNADDEQDCAQSCLGWYSFHCADGEKCIPYVQVCNYNYDCADRSDEKDCDCGEQDYSCNNGRCINTRLVCDGFEDCAEGEDEQDCSCPRHLEACPNDPETCIHSDMLCDGHWDCVDGTDEMNCSECHSGGVNCSSSPSVCVHQEQICDGVEDCPGGTDELRCDDTDCSYPKFPCSGAQCLEESAVCDGTEDCPTGKDEINCDCGKISPNILSQPDPLILHGNEAESGMWPWQVSLRYLNVFQCGGAVISPDWVLTAAHCVENDMLPRHYTIRAGTNSLYGYDDNAQVLVPDEVHMHPNYDNYEILNDVALLKLTTPLQWTDYIRSVCLPRNQQQNGSHTNCYTTGWGRVNADVGTHPEQLQELKTKIWRNWERPCYLKSHTSQLCAGYYGGTGTASGDSGGPLVCEVHNNRWEIVGVTSYGSYSSDGYDYFADVWEMLPWIDDIMSSKNAN